MPRVLVIGSSNTDLIIRASKLPSPGETVLGGTFFIAGGGKGANQAVAAARDPHQRSNRRAVGESPLTTSPPCPIFLFPFPDSLPLSP